MNKYIIPICDVAEPPRCWIEIIMAGSGKECQEKLMDRLYRQYDIEEADNYHDFVNKADEENIIIGNIADIEEL